MDKVAQGRTKILVPVNFSAKSEMALDFALSYSRERKEKMEIYLFHVFEEATKNFRRLDRLNEEYMDRMKNMVIKAIERVYKLGFQHSVDDVHRRMAHGKASVEILKMADAIQADLLVMGAPTASGFNRFISETPCSMVLLKPKDLA
ncbi:MAG: universal stress protein [Myxococcota bacterium]